MVGNTKQRGVGDLFKRALMALYLLKILEATPFFYNGGSDPRNVKLSDKVAMGAVLLKHLQVTPTKESFFLQSQRALKKIDFFRKRNHFFYLEVV